MQCVICAFVLHYLLTIMSVCVIVCVRARQQDEHACLLLERGKILKRLERNVVSQKYLQAVVDAAEDFREIKEIIARHATLTATHQVCHNGLVAERRTGDQHEPHE